MGRKSFPERIGLRRIQNLQSDELPDYVRKRIWNKLKLFIEACQTNESLLLKIWDGFFKENLDEIEDVRLGYKFGAIKEEFDKLSWDEVLDLVDYVVYHTEGEGGDEVLQMSQVVVLGQLTKSLNEVFEEERVPYRIIDCRVVPLLGKEEASSVEDIFSLPDNYKLVQNHFRKALIYYSQRPTPDYSNSVKEAVSSIEALARLVTKKESGVLSELAQDLPIHSALKESLKKLYGWAGDEGGIRHAEKKTSKVDSTEARFILVIASALIHYVVASRSSKS